MNQKSELPTGNWQLTLEPISNQQKFRVCPSCGNLTPAEKADCEYCQFNSEETLAAPQENVEDRRFFEALFTRPNPFTLLFIGINAGMFILEWLAGGMGSLAVDPTALVALGAKVNSLIDQQQYWRFITSMFLHIGFLHFLLNNYALYIIGLEIERIYGSARFVILYFVTGLVGSFASYLFTEATSAGASGAIFGLFGVMATFAFRYRKEIPKALSRDIKRRVIPIIAINLVFGFSVSIVDNSAHLGGLLSGVLLALVIPYKRPEESATPAVWRAGQYLLLAVAFASFVLVFANYDGPKLSIDNLRADPRERIERYVNKIEVAEKGLVDSLNSFRSALREGNTDAQPALEAAERGLAALKEVSKLEGERIEEARRQLLELLTWQKDIIERFNRAERKNWRQVAEEEEQLIEKAKQYKLIREDEDPDASEKT